MLEVELKFRLTDEAELIASMENLGAGAARCVSQSAHYFNHPQRDFSQTDEVTDGCGAITYKGPLVDKETKTRREIEIDLTGPQAAEKMCECLMALGFRSVHTVQKRRRMWSLSRAGRDFEVALDDVVGLGRFVELETAATEEELPAARSAIQQLAAELGLRNGERRGYLTLLLAVAGEGTRE
ncbi:MAG: class IV adenylate cyclase [Planctomycetota bacterium]|nr:class IV adenylate cyclase [Planctomycetota bacterium]